MNIIYAIVYNKRKKRNHTTTKKDIQLKWKKNLQ